MLPEENDPPSRPPPAQSEINYDCYCEVVSAAAPIHLYKIDLPRSATSIGMTASFLPPVVGVNGQRMHTNVSRHERRVKNIFSGITQVVRRKVQR